MYETPTVTDATEKFPTLEDVITAALRAGIYSGTAVQTIADAVREFYGQSVPT